MEIILNGSAKSVDENTTLAALIAELDLENQRFATEVNGELVPKSTLESFILSEGDKIEIVGAIGGG